MKKKDFVSNKKRLLTIRLDTVGHEFLVNYITLSNVVSSGYSNMDWYQCIAPWDHFNFVCIEVCGHTVRKLTHPQTEAGSVSINKIRPILRLYTMEHEPKLTKLQ